MLKSEHQIGMHSRFSVCVCFFVFFTFALLRLFTQCGLDCWSVNVFNVTSWMFSLLASGRCSSIQFKLTFLEVARKLLSGKWSKFDENNRTQINSLNMLCEIQNEKERERRNRGKIERRKKIAKWRYLIFMSKTKIDLELLYTWKKWHKEMPKLYSSSCHFVHLIFNFVSFHLYFELLEL